MAGQEWRLLERIGPVRRTGNTDRGRQPALPQNAHDEVVCLDIKTGRKIWGVNLASQFQGRRDGFGRAESLLIDGDRVICSPGGATAMAALDKKTGRTVWKSPRW